MKKSHSSKHWVDKPNAYKEYLLQRNFGISLEDFNSLLDSQGHSCAICRKQNGSDKHRGKHTKQLGVDHDHDTGAVRGLLCNDCNRALGQFKDNPEYLRRAADYVEFHKKLHVKACSTVDSMLEALMKC